MKGSRERWPSRTLFIFAVVGSAVGLGNVWRFPYLVGKYGGGAFVLPYLIVLFAIGLPLLIMEFAIGQKMQAGAVGSFRKIHPKLSGIGLGAIMNCIGVSAYYSVVMSWCLLYAYFSFSQSWAGDPKHFFFQDILHVSATPNEIQGFSPLVLGALVLSWILVYFCLWKGVKGVSKVVQITMPLPIVLLLILLVRTFTLPGASEGISFFLKPDFTALLNPEVWLAAMTQVFFTLSLGFGTMITYASYMNKKSDIVMNAVITSIVDVAIAITAGFVVFATIGYMAKTGDQSIAELAGSGPSLAFIVLSKALSLMPGAVFISFIFFVMLITLAIDSLFSMVEAVITLFEDYYLNTNKKMIVFYVCFGIFLMSLIFATTAGIYYLDIVDHYITNYVLVFMGMLQAVAIGWVYGASKLRGYINSVSKIQLGSSWDFLIKYFIPISLTIIIFNGLRQDIATPYEGYPKWALWTFGWGLVAVVLVVSGAFSYFSTKNDKST